MAAVTVDTGYPIIESLGSLKLLIYSLASASNLDTLNVGSIQVLGSWVNSNIAKMCSGTNILLTTSSTSSTLTFYIQTTSNLFVYVIGKG